MSTLDAFNDDKRDAAYYINFFEYSVIPALLLAFYLAASYFSVLKSRYTLLFFATYTVLLIYVIDPAVNYVWIDFINKRFGNPDLSSISELDSQLPDIDNMTVPGEPSEK